MRRLIILSAAVLMLGPLTGCRKSAPSTSAPMAYSPPMPPRNSADSHEALMRDMIAVTNETSEVFETIKDDASGRAAAPKLEKLLPKRLSLLDRMFDLSDQEEEYERIKQKYGAERDKAEKRYKSAVAAAESKCSPEVWELIKNAMRPKAPGK